MDTSDTIDNKNSNKSVEERVQDTLDHIESIEQIDDSQLPRSVLDKFKQDKPEDCQ